MKYRAPFAALLVCGALSATPLLADTFADTFRDLVDQQGNISLPDNFRTTWTHLGSYAVGSAGMNDTNAPTLDLHQVYTQPESISYYREHGEFPDGAVLVKTVSGTESATLTTGQAHYQADTKVTFVMVKDRRQRFPDNTAWGEGWGWALFSGEQPGKSQTTDWKGEGFNNCHGCHLPAKDNDWVYTQGYRKLLSH